MTDTLDLEAQVKCLLAADLTSTEFSNRVFGQFHGLFARMCNSAEDRKQLITSPIWKAAQARLRELETRDFAKIRRLVAVSKSVQV